MKLPNPPVRRVSSLKGPSFFFFSKKKKNLRILQESSQIRTFKKKSSRRVGVRGGRAERERVRGKEREREERGYWGPGRRKGGEEEKSPVLSSPGTITKQMCFALLSTKPTQHMCFCQSAPKTTTKHLCIATVHRKWTEKHTKQFGDLW